MNFETKKQKDRYAKLVQNGIPRYIRCYDNNGKSIDAYTVTFTGHYRDKSDGVFWYLGMSSNPFHPQGVGYQNVSEFQIDRPSYSHLGKKIKYEDLPAECQTFVMITYLSLWDFIDEFGYTIK